MSWPTTGAGSIASGYVASGEASYFRWGAKGSVVGWESYTITRVSQKRKREDLQFDNGDGIQSGRVQLFHGIEWEVTVRDDTRMAPPNEGTYLTMVDMAGHVGTPGLTYNAYVLDSAYDTAQKQPGERVIKLERITLIEGA